MNTDLLQAAARLVAEEGLDYDRAKRRAAEALGLDARRTPMPSHEQLEDAVREHLALFQADTQPAELAALRDVALAVMARLQAFAPHLRGAVWRGTATRLSPVVIDLYVDDPKAPELALLNAGVAFDSDGGDARDGRGAVLTLAEPCRALGEAATVHLVVNAMNDLRGALKPDSRGRSWRGSVQAVRALQAVQAQGPG
ncbi:MAG: hypothetical protein LCH73_15210 [Proteobacteria bacterium]|nr:hypothetical protein [Pseudomonadota bacterium]